jgi:hypothetical protein
MNEKSIEIPQRDAGRRVTTQSAKKLPQALRRNSHATSRVIPGDYLDLRLVVCPMRPGKACCNRLTSRQLRPCVGPLQLLQRHSRGRAQIDATEHQVRLSARSWGPFASTARGASDAPHIVVLRQHVLPTAPVEYRPPQHVRHSSSRARNAATPTTTTSRHAPGRN